MFTKAVQYRIMFNREKRLDKNGKAAILIEAYQNGRRRYFNTGIRKSPKDWDTKKNVVKADPRLFIELCQG